MQTFAVKAINVMLVISMICTYHAVVSDRKANEDAVKQQLAAQQAAAKSEETASLYADGVYTGEGQGYGGKVEIEVTVSGGKITDCTVLSADKEDTAYFDAAQAVLDDVLAEQSADVDTVSGATFSSKGILGAVADALEKAVQHE